MSHIANPGEQVTLRAKIAKIAVDIKQAEAHAASRANIYDVAVTNYEAKVKAKAAVDADPKATNEAKAEAAAAVEAAEEKKYAALYDISDAAVLLARLSHDLAAATSRAKAAYAI